MENVLCLRLLGTVQVEQAGEPVRGFRSRKALALLGYLAVQGQPVSRERLADLFWEDAPEARGRANLSWVLNRISTRLPGCLQADRHTVQFCCPANYWLDTDAFGELAKQGDPVSLTRAVELYRGEFLEGLYLDDCAELEIWLASEREWWRQRVAGVLEALITQHSRRGDYDLGLYFSRRLLVLEPWREEAHRQMMRLLAWSGQRAAALAQYKACCHAMAEELGVEPAAETTRLYRQIHCEELEIPPSLLVRLPDFSVPLPSFLKEKQGTKMSTLVARERELARLAAFLDGALSKRGRVVFVTGDAGQGKTALLQEFVRRALAARPDLVVAGGNGNAHTGIGDPYLPFREVLSLLAGDVEAQWAAGAMDREQACRLWRMLPLTVDALLETGPDLLDTLIASAFLLERVAALEMMIAGGMNWLSRLKDLVEHRAGSPFSPGPQQSNLFEQFTQVLRVLARERPLLLVLDDLQWADLASISLLFHLGRRIEDSRILIVGAYRPAEVSAGRDGKRHPLAPIANEFRRQFGEIEVDLEQAQGRQFVEAFLDALPSRLSPAFHETLYRQTGGQPLFTAELLRGMQERGDLIQNKESRWVEGSALDWETLPARVEAVIAERIDRLPESSRQVLKVASVEGEVFTAEVAARVRKDDRQHTIECLSGKLDREHRLVQAQGVERSGAERLSRYRFRHILFQRYLYNSLDPVERTHLHEVVGEALEGLCGEEDVALQLAQHFQEAGVVEKAVAYLRQAGERAVRMSAHEEAVAHYRRALALLERLPESVGRGQTELMLQVGLVASLQVVKGYGDPELDRIYGRAQELCRRAGETPQLLPVLSQLTILHTNRGEHQAAREVAEQYLDLAKPCEDPVHVAPVQYALGWYLTILGEFVHARARLEKAIAFYDSQRHHPLTVLYGYDFGVAALSTLSWALWFLGYPDQALERGQEALALARDLAHPFSFALAQGQACLLHAFRRDVQSVKESAEACTHLSAEYGFPYWAVFGTFFCGWALAHQGDAEEGGEEMHQGIVSARAMGTDVGHTLRLVMLAEVYGEAGRVEDGLDLLAEASETSRRTGERVYETEAHRLRGELLLKQEAEAKAEASFHEAIEVARQQSTKSLELRATMSLCRMWHSLELQDRRVEARQRLVEIYDWFTEGFDTVDLVEAKVLLEALQ